MGKILTIALWELKKIFGNWKKALAVFLLPAALMMAALNLFPMLIDYLTTGSFGGHKILLIDAPDSFNSYIDSIDGTTVYKFSNITSKEYSKYSDDEIKSLLKKGTILVDFNVDFKPGDFDKEVSAFYGGLASGDLDTSSDAIVFIGYDQENPGMEPKAEQFTETIMDPYEDYLLENLGGDYASQGAQLFSVNAFNPVNKILDYRSVANASASRVIPGIMVLLMYYCTYALASDMFALEKERGFYNKLILTPVSRKNIFLGKLFAINAIVTISALITFFMMFISSWLNHSNDAMSLLPFGMFLTPGQLLIVIFETVPCAFLMGSIAINIIFDSNKLQDTITFLQFPLVLFLFEFFIHMFRYTRPLWLEYVVPLHNTLQIFRDVFSSEEGFVSVIIVAAVNIYIGFIILRKTLRKELSR
ncbi:MAG: ABC transporter permease subunit [Saccharofermentans sp.]|nr:ABC transporter permease subunit [Saccharofermentans sp.]